MPWTKNKLISKCQAQLHSDKIPIQDYLYVIRLMLYTKIVIYYEWYLCLLIYCIYDVLNTITYYRHFEYSSSCSRLLLLLLLSGRVRCVKNFWCKTSFGMWFTVWEIDIWTEFSYMIIFLCVSFFFFDLFDLYYELK